MYFEDQEPSQVWPMQSLLPFLQPQLPSSCCPWSPWQGLIWSLQLLLQPYLSNQYFLNNQYFQYQQSVAMPVVFIYILIQLGYSSFGLLCYLLLPLLDASHFIEVFFELTVESHAVCLILTFKWLFLFLTQRFPHAAHDIRKLSRIQLGVLFSYTIPLLAKEQEIGRIFFVFRIIFLSPFIFNPQLLLILHLLAQSSQGRNPLTIREVFIHWRSSFVQNRHFLIGILKLREIRLSLGRHGRLLKFGNSGLVYFRGLLQSNVILVHLCYLLQGSHKLL